MSEWSEIALGNLFASSTPGEWGDELQGSGEGVFVLRSTNFTDSGRVDYSSVVRRGISTAKLLKCQLQRGDILLEKSGGGPDQPVGRVVLFDGGDGGTYACSNFIQRLVVGAAYDPTFVLYRMLQGYADGLTTRYEQQTTGIRNLKLTDLLSEKLLVPSLPEQREIARILSTVDDLIERTEALIAKYRAIKQGLMHDLLTRGVDATGRLRPPREEAPGLYRESAVGWVPREWDVTTLGEQLTLQRGFDITQEQQRPGEIPVVSSSGITSFHSEAMCQGPGVVIGRKGKLGQAYYIDGPHWPHDTSLWVKDFHGNFPRFAALFLEWLRLERFDAATSVPTLNRNFIHPMRVAIPPRKEQERIADLLVVETRYMQAEEEYLAKLKLLKAGLMQDLLTGRVRVKVDKQAERPA